MLVLAFKINFIMSVKNAQENNKKPFFHPPSNDERGKN